MTEEIAAMDTAAPVRPPRYMLGGEQVLRLEGEPLVDAKGRTSHVTSAGSEPSLGEHLLAYLPADHALAGTGLGVEYLGEQYPVAVVGATPLFDPRNDRVRC
jgi:glycine cleavage system aminomethyltransferase T